jgi:hypothetical protein
MNLPPWLEFLLYLQKTNPSLFLRTGLLTARYVPRFPMQRHVKSFLQAHWNFVQFYVAVFVRKLILVENRNNEPRHIPNTNDIGWNREAILGYKSVAIQ